MKFVYLLAALSLSLPALAHPDGTYEINTNPDATVTFKFLQRCPKDVEGALAGGLRILDFSEAAQSDPYWFGSGHFVEIHNELGEVYVETDDQCIPIDQGQQIPASRNTFGGFPLRRVPRAG